MFDRVPTPDPVPASPTISQLTKPRSKPLFVLIGGNNAAGTQTSIVDLDGELHGWVTVVVGVPRVREMDLGPLNCAEAELLHPEMMLQRSVTRAAALRRPTGACRDVGSKAKRSV